MRNKLSSIKSNRVVISIVNYYSSNQCINLLQAIDNSKRINIKKVIIIDNSMNLKEYINLRNIKKNYSEMDIIIKKQKNNTGYSGGHNLSLKILKEIDLKYDCLIVINPDITFGKHDLARMVKCIKNKYAAAMSATRDYDSGQILYSTLKFDGLITKKIINENASTIETDYLAGSLFAIRKSMINRTKPLFKNFFMYWEDSELSIRIKKNGGLLCSVLNKNVYRQKNDHSRSKYAVYFSLINAVKVANMHRDVFRKIDLIKYFIVTISSFVISDILYRIKVGSKSAK